MPIFVNVQYLKSVDINYKKHICVEPFFLPEGPTKQKLEPPGRRAGRGCEALFLQNENEKTIPFAIETFANFFSIIH